MTRSPATRRRQGWLIALMAFGSYAYFYQAGGWNQNTRFDLVRALVEQGTTRIDAYWSNTGDKAIVGDHVYADKAPGASLVAVPGVALVRAAQRIAGTDLGSESAVVWLSYVATIMAASLPAAMAVLGIFWIAIWLGADDRSASVAALVTAFATPLWAYATILYGHALAAACLVGAFAGVVSLTARTRPAHDRAIGVLTGLAAGWAVVTEYPSAVPAGFVLLCGAWQMRGEEPERRRRLLVSTLAGMAIAGVVLMSYSWISFGSFFHIGYSSEPGYEGMRRGVFGISWPKAHVLWEILFGSYRGLLPLAPVLALAPIGYGMWWRDRAVRAAVLTAMAIVTYHFAFTAGYAYWDGGWSYASRHLAPALPFLALAAAPIWQRTRAIGHAAIVALFLASAGQSLIAVSTTPQPPAPTVQHPMRDLLWPAFRTGELAFNWQSIFDRTVPAEPPSQLVAHGIEREAWNLGIKAGFHGRASLIPLLLFWAAGAVVWMNIRHEERPTPRASGLS